MTQSRHGLLFRCSPSQEGVVALDLGQRPQTAQAIAAGRDALDLDVTITSFPLRLRYASLACCGSLRV